YQNSEIYKAKSDIEKQTSEYLKIKKEQEEARKIAKEQEALANRPWYEKALDYGGNIVNELTGVNDAKRAATGVDPITGEELTAGQRVAAGGMAAAGYIPIVGWAGRIFKGGKAVYKTTQATSVAVRAVDIYKTSQKSFDALKTSQKGLYGLTATNGFSEAITGRDMFGNKISKEQQEASMNAALGMLLPFGAKGFHGKMGIKGNKIEHPVLDNKRVGSALKKPDGQHGFNDIIDNYTPLAKEFDLVGGDKTKVKLYQIEGGMKYYSYKDVYNKDLRIIERVFSVKDQNGIFEWIVDPNKGVTHRRFIPEGEITGLPNQNPKR
ncbi:pre-toxin TG domain-containing protein, partial [Bacillus safensis]